MAASGEPLATGVIPRLARPGGNVTGLSAFTNELIPKRIELLNLAVPGVTRIAFLQNMSNPVAPPQWEELNSAARSLRIEPLLLDVRKSEDMVRAFESMGSPWAMTPSRTRIDCTLSSLPRSIGWQRSMP